MIWIGICLDPIIGKAVGVVLNSLLSADNGTTGQGIAVIVVRGQLLRPDNRR